MIDWNLASFVEFQKAVELYMALETKLAPPFVTGENGTSEEIATRDLLLEKVLALREKGSVDSALQRSRGNESGAALGDDHESREAYVVTGAD